MKYLSLILLAGFLCILFSCDSMVTNLSIGKDLPKIEKMVIKKNNETVVRVENAQVTGRLLVGLGANSDVYSIAFYAANNKKINLEGEALSFCCNNNDPQCASVVKSDDLLKDEFMLRGHKLGEALLCFELHNNEAIAYASPTLRVHVRDERDFPYPDVP